MTQRTLEDLQAYKDRLQTDIRRSRQIDPDGLSGGAYAVQGQKPVLVRNLEQVNKDIANYKPEEKKPLTEEAK